MMHILIAHHAIRCVATPWRRSQNMIVHPSLGQFCMGSTGAGCGNCQHVQCTAPTRLLGGLQVTYLQRPVAGTQTSNLCRSSTTTDGFTTLPAGASYGRPAKLLVGSCVQRSRAAAAVGYSRSGGWPSLLPPGDPPCQALNDIPRAPDAACTCQGCCRCCCCC
jgi:hypothetical protein